MASNIEIKVVENVIESTSTDNIINVQSTESVVEIHNADGLNGITPHIGENGNWWVGTTDTGVHAQGEQGEKGESGENGKDGEDGKDGLTPYIGANGNWFVGDVDLGVKAQGEQGEQGIQGESGKSAYEQAVEGGYTGTEQEFNCSLSLLADVAEGKKQIASAINVKGGTASAENSFSQLAENVLAMPTSGIFANGVTQTEPFCFLKYLTSDINNEITEINNSEITKIARNYAFYRNTALREVVMNNLVTISGANAFGSCSSLQNVQLPNLATISGGNAFGNCSSLQNVQLPNLAVISGANTFYNCTSLPSVQLPNLVTISGANAFGICSSLQNVQLPNLAVISGANTFYNCTSLQSIELGILIQCNEPFGNYKPKLRNITIQDADINLPFQNWTATSVINEGQNGIDELNNNLRTNLLEKLADHSTDGQTRTLRLGWLAHVTQENIDYANSKGWTLTT